MGHPKIPGSPHVLVNGGSAYIPLYRGLLTSQHQAPSFQFEHIILMILIPFMYDMHFHDII